MPGAGVSSNVSENCEPEVVGLCHGKHNPQAWFFLVTKSSGSLLTELYIEQKQMPFPGPDCNTLEVPCPYAAIA